jgi:hypothetical protein
VLRANEIRRTTGAKKAKGSNNCKTTKHQNQLLTEEHCETAPHDAKPNYEKVASASLSHVDIQPTTSMASEEDCSASWDVPWEGFYVATAAPVCEASIPIPTPDTGKEQDFWCTLQVRSLRVIYRSK